jgi:hypothetical protein
MTRHPSEEVLLELGLGEGDAESRGHLRQCGECAERVARLEGTQALLREAEVPDPSPLYWESLRRNVAARIAAEPPPARGWRVWFWRPALGALALAVALGGGLALEGPQREAPLEHRLPAWSALPPAAEDVALVALDGALASGEEPVLGGCEGLAGCLASLTDEETLALADELRSALRSAS